ncbi:MAG TPA: replicative helicase loader/inhibitor [Smithellaceae bacterium]|nr:replicative helicase loader/inhibitor [Smithellaceae bacterium]
MNRVETIKIMAILKASYPAFYSKIPPDEYAGIASIWQESFSKEPYELVAVAVKSLIKTHSGYPPDIATISTELKNLVSAATGEPTDEEYWNIYKKAVMNSGYCENETFDKLPPILQRYCGSARTLYEHAMMPLDVFNSVLHGQFLKQLPIMRQRQEYRESLPEPVRQMISGMSQRMTLPEAEKPATPQELNDKRNAIVAELVALPPPNPDYVPISAEEKEKRKQDILSKLVVNG